MPRLEGERSGGGIVTIILVIVAIIVVFLLLEYFGVINLIPNFP